MPGAPFGYGPPPAAGCDVPACAPRRRVHRAARGGRSGAAGAGPGRGGRGGGWGRRGAAPVRPPRPGAPPFTWLRDDVTLQFWVGGWWGFVVHEVDPIGKADLGTPLAC